MRKACSLIWSALVLLFRSRASLAAEILVLRHQINILRRHSPKRQTFSAMDRLIFAGLYRLAPTVLNALIALQAAATASRSPPNPVAGSYCASSDCCPGLASLQPRADSEVISPAAIAGGKM